MNKIRNDITQPKISTIQEAPTFQWAGSPLDVADTYTEKAIVGTLMAIDTLSHISPFRWLFNAKGCEAEETQETKPAQAPPFTPTDDETLRPNEPIMSYDKVCNGKDDNADGLIDNIEPKFLTIIQGEYSSLTEEPRWSPDGEKIAFQIDGTLQVANRDGSQRRELLRGDFANTGCFTWLEDGSDIVFYQPSFGFTPMYDEEHAGMYLAFSGRKLLDIDEGGCPLGTSSRQDIRFIGNGGCFQVSSLNSITMEKTIVADFRERTSENPEINRCRWSVFTPSPDKKKIAAIGFNGFGWPGGKNMSVLDIENNHILQIGQDHPNLNKESPVIWFPDNRQFLFHNTLEPFQRYQIWIADSETGEIRPLNKRRDDQMACSISPLGEVVLASAKRANSEIELFSEALQRGARLTFKTSFNFLNRYDCSKNVTWSPDGEWLTIAAWIYAPPTKASLASFRRPCPSLFSTPSVWETVE